MTFSLTILGSSSALPTSNRFPTAHLLNVNERFFLIDCGEGTQIQLRKYGARFGKINRIFISHMHGDHIFGLYGLLSSFQLLGRKADLHIHGPGELREYIGFYTSHFAHEQDFRVTVHPVGHRRTMVVYEDDKMEVTSIPLKHRIPVTGFLFREKPADLNIKKEAVEKYAPGVADMVSIKKGKDFITPGGTKIPNRELTLPPWKPRSYAYLSDTAYKPSVAEIIKDTDLVYHEATFDASDTELAGQTMHSTSAQAAMVAREAGAGKLLLGHFSSRYKSLEKLAKDAREIFPESYVVNDGDVFHVERTRMKRD